MRTIPSDITENRHGGNPESAEANQRIQASKSETRRTILSLYRRAGEAGLTADEVAIALHCTHNHVAPRISELKALGRLTVTKHRRPTRSGCSARVLVAARSAPKTQVAVQTNNGLQQASLL